MGAYQNALREEGSRADLMAALEKAWTRIDELHEACAKADEEICQTLGQVLGYPWFKEDPKNFPAATLEDGVCVGDHVAETLAVEAAAEIRRLREKLTRKEEQHEKGWRP